MIQLKSSYVRYPMKTTVNNCMTQRALHSDTDIRALTASVKLRAHSGDLRNLGLDGWIEIVEIENFGMGWRL